MTGKLITVSHFILIVAIFLASCSRQSVGFNKSTIVPAASGGIKIKKDKNSNYLVELKISNLAPADRLSPPKDHYVLWMETNANGVQNLGRLVSSKPLFGKAFKATLNTTTTYTPSKFFITAEDGVELNNPNGLTILSTDRLQDGNR